MTADLPSAVQQAVEVAWRSVLARPDRHLMSGYRIPIYQALGIPDTDHGRRVHAWLGIHVAEKVLPIYQIYQAADVAPRASRMSVHRDRTVKAPGPLSRSD